MNLMCDCGSARKVKMAGVKTDLRETFVLL